MGATWKYVGAPTVVGQATSTKAVNPQDAHMDLPVEM